MAGVSTSVYKFDNVVRSQHIYRSVWTPLNDETRKFIMLEDNKHDKYTVNLTVNDRP